MGSSPWWSHTQRWQVIKLFRIILNKSYFLLLLSFRVSVCVCVARERCVRYLAGMLCVRRENGITWVWWAIQATQTVYFHLVKSLRPHLIHLCRFIIGADYLLRWGAECMLPTRNTCIRITYVGVCTSHIRRRNRNLLLDLDKVAYVLSLCIHCRARVLCGGEHSAIDAIGYRSI